MGDISRRIRSIEKRLNFREEPITLGIVHFGKKLPPDRTEGNITYHFVRHKKQKRK